MFKEFVCYTSRAIYFEKKRVMYMFGGVKIKKIDTQSFIKANSGEIDLNKKVLTLKGSINAIIWD